MHSGGSDGIRTRFRHLYTETARYPSSWLQALDGVIDVIIDTLEGRFQGQLRLGEIVEAILGLSAHPQPEPVFSAWTKDLESGESLSELAHQFTQRDYPCEDRAHRDTEVAENAAERFKERLTELSARCRTVDELIGLVLSEDWETEFEESTGTLGFIDGPSGASTDGFIDGPSRASTDGFIDGPS